ncbi:dolichyl-phosphate-mannose--protein mannosyltransferase [Coleofasciculus sp. F4-SAH-05]|uniref:dolichyl-phosphate-mannose--protein mannosyltransferase n=1 Tax=Coleofasciculus sp. F4-SAH-05 TaxID=3069525 RepID=UPI003301E03A
MNLYQGRSIWSVSWFWLGIASVLFLSLSLRFWKISQFNTLVFDEVYIAKFANNYLTHTPFWHSHPPLGKYLIAIGIWIASLNPFGYDSLNSLTGSILSPFSYRWLNALIGSLIPLVIAGIAYQLSHRRSYALIAGLLAAADGLLLVESRYALLNIYLLFFGLLGQWLFLLALDNQPGRRGFFLTLSGACFGASTAVKWSGLGFLVGIYLVWISAWVIRWLQSFRSIATYSSSASNPSATIMRHGASTYTPLQNLTQLKLSHLLFDLGAIPALVYRLAWIPHLQLNPELNFWTLQKLILVGHQQVGSGSEVHPYCSLWYTWPWMIRPVAYFYYIASDIAEPVPSLGPPLPGNAGTVIYAVNGMGNPVLWWLSTATILFLLGILAKRICLEVTVVISKSLAVQQSISFTGIDCWIGLYLVLNYTANYLPWMKVTRCTFLYHYIGASIFAFLAIAWMVDLWLRSNQPRLQALGVTVIFLILLAFIFWLPVYLGLPLSSENFLSRMWFRSWI